MLGEADAENSFRAFREIAADGVRLVIERVTHPDSYPNLVFSRRDLQFLCLLIVGTTEDAQLLLLSGLQIES